MPGDTTGVGKATCTWSLGMERSVGLKTKDGSSTSMEMDRDEEERRRRPHVLTHGRVKIFGGFRVGTLKDGKVLGPIGWSDGRT